MRAVTVQQPWAWSIFHGKAIENRTQNWGYRGPLAIHAGLRWSDRGDTSTLVRAAFTEQFPQFVDVLSGKLPRWPFTMGEILGVVDLVDCHPDAGCCRPWGESSYVEHGGRARRRVTHLVLENPRLLADPIPCRGALGLWTPPADITERLEALT
ncbi:hypothetical protein [Mycolicibacterium sp. A43C]